MIACLAAFTVFSGCDKDPDPQPDNGADFLSFTFDGIVGKAVIDKDALTVTAIAAETVDLDWIIATFTLSNGATAEMYGFEVKSGTHIFDFTETAIINVTSSDKRLTNIWKVTVTKGSKKYITYNKPVTAYYIEYTEDGKSKFEAYENKEYCHSFGETYIYIGSEEINYTWAGNNHWYKHTGDPVYVGSWLSEKYKEHEYPLGNFAAYVSNYKGTTTFYKYGLSLADVAASDNLEMPNKTDVTELYVRSERVMEILCNVYKASETGSGGTATWTWWVDHATGFTLKYEYIDRDGDIESYEVTKLVVGKPDWDGKHLRPKQNDTIENVD
jgi:hypothetical protein